MPDVRGPLWEAGQACLNPPHPSPSSTGPARTWKPAHSQRQPALPHGSAPEARPGSPCPGCPGARRVPTLRPRELGALVPTRWRDAHRSGTEFSPTAFVFISPFIPILTHPHPIANHLYVFLQHVSMYFSLSYLEFLKPVHVANGHNHSLVGNPYLFSPL